MCPDCLEQMRDISAPGKYNNYGFHGDGLATAADSMAAIRKYVYDEKTFTPAQMLDMLHADFKGYEREQNMLRYEGPKFGNDDDFVDSIAVQLLDWGAGSTMTQSEIKSAVTAWLSNKGNDAQVAFSQQMDLIDTTCQTLMGSGARELLNSAGCQGVKGDWPVQASDRVEAILEAVGLRG